MFVLAPQGAGPVPVVLQLHSQPGPDEDEVLERFHIVDNAVRRSRGGERATKLRTINARDHAPSYPPEPQVVGVGAAARFHH